MTRVMNLAYVVLIALTLVFGAAYAPLLASNMSTQTVAQPPPTCPDDPGCDEVAGDPSQWGVESAVYKKGSFDITESEGSEELVAAGGTSKGGDVPVVTGLASGVNEYEGQHRV